MVSEIAKRIEEQQSNGHVFTGNLWETMLREAMRKSRLPDSTVVFVGPQGCGKSSLLETFLEGPAYLDPSSSTAAAATAAVVPTTETGPESGAGVAGSGSPDAGQNTSSARGFHPVLGYSYLEAADPAEQGSERDDTPPRISFWCCGEVDFEELLQTVLQPSSLANTAVMVGVDLSRPWEIMDTVKKWTGILERHVTELMKRISVGAQDDLRNAVRERWLAAARSGVPGGKGGCFGAAGRNQDEGDPSVANLGEGVLEKNLGVPMVIVGCKADSLQSGTFEQQQRLHFIQQSLRRFCLKYGAGMVYTSVKDGVNCGLLHRYLLSLLYPDAFPCKEEGQTTDAAFTPAGWDSMRLINSLLSAEKTPWGPDALFQDVVAVPPNAGRGHGGADDAVAGADLNAKPKEPEEAVESEEMWLSRLDKQVPDDGSKRSQKQPLPGRRPITKTPGELRNFFETLMRSGGNASPPKSDVPRKKI